MRELDSYISEYSDSHQHPLNVAIHKICVPAIVFSILGITKALPVPVSWPLWLDWSVLMVGSSLIYYSFFRNIRVLVAFFILISSMQFVLELLRPRFFLLSLGIFVLAWIGQFIGHKIEGRKPSFFKDLFFLLIGPIWTMHSLARQMGIDLKIFKSQ